MKTYFYLWIFICVLVSGANVYAQDNKKEDSMIEFGTKFTLKLSENDYSYSVIDKEPYTKTLGLTDIRSMFSQEDIKKDEIMGVLAYGKLGNDRQVFLILKNGLSTPLSYKLEIKQGNKTHFESTSVANLYPQVPSTEIWPYDIDYSQYRQRRFGFKESQLERFVLEQLSDFEE